MVFILIIMFINEMKVIEYHEELLIELSASELKCAFKWCLFTLNRIGLS